MWYSVDCAVQGLGHKKTDTPCQDKTCIFTSDDISVIALADGAGSASLSHFGAETVAKKAAEILSVEFDQYFAEPNGAEAKTKFHNDLFSALVMRADELGCEYVDLASTMLVVAVKNDKYIIAHIGDGVIGYLKNGELKVASEPKNGEFSNETVFVTSPDALYEMKMMKGDVGEVSGFVIMSDGTEASLYNRHDKYLAPVLKKIIRLCAMLPESVVKSQLQKSFETVIRNATQDDCSIAVLAKNDGEDRYYDLPERERQALLQINADTSNAKKRLKRYEAILNMLQTPHNRVQIARAIHIKPKHIKKHLDRLLQLGLIEKNGGVYLSFLAQ